MNAPLPRSRKLARRLSAILIGYLLAELVLVPIVARSASIRLVEGMPRAMQVLAQSSKAGLIPRDYTLLLGDSYAEGHGDWLAEGVRRGGKPPYQAAHVIHERTGEDVISFGAGGASSATALVGNPLERRLALRRFFVPAPRRVLAYFYEGNDLDDNLGYVRRRILEEGEELEHASARRIEEHLRGALVARSRLEGSLASLYLPGILENTLEMALDSEGPASEGGAPPEAANLARIGGAAVPLGEPMQGPSLELTPGELDLGLLVFERSLAFCRELYRDAELTVVYIPSPLACYELAGPEVRARSYHGRSPSHPAALVRQRSREIRDRVRAIAADLGAGFLDTTPAFQELGHTTFVHGPEDWKHFNAAGYRLLGEEIVRRIHRAAP